MIDYLVRLIKRLFVLLPGLVISYFAAREVFPLLDKRIPASLAVFVTYVITAYGLIPGGLRLVRLFIKTKHIPLYSTTPDGFASDPVNIGLIGTRDELVDSMEKAGWYLADKRSIKNLIKMILAIILKKPYPRAPFSSLYLFGRSQDLGFELPVDTNPLHRHHVRFWAAAWTSDPRYEEHVSFWRKHHQPTLADRYLWIGAASLDEGFGLIRHNAQFTHMIHHDTDAERELIVRQLMKAGRVKRTKVVRLGAPYRLINRVWTGYLHTDGIMKICDLKPARR